MSRIGKIPVPVPAGVKVAVDGPYRRCGRSQGQARTAFPPQVAVKFDEAWQEGRRHSARRNARAQGHARPGPGARPQHDRGRHQGYEKKLEIVGVGYLAAIKRTTLQFASASPTSCKFPIPPNLKVTCPDQTHVVDSRAPTSKRSASSPPKSARSASPSRTKARAFATTANKSAARPARQ